MPNWNKVIVSGSDAVLSSVTATAGLTVTGSARITGSLEVTGSFNQASASLATGLFSHVQGFANTASGIYSHAEGQSNKAIGDASHAEGQLTTANGPYSHAEGYGTITNGFASHTEGQSNIATGQASHAEGLGTTANGSFSHAEGYGTLTTGDYSHAEGLSTVALGNYQHVLGQYNLSLSAQSAFIVGNGVDASNRSNLIFASGSQVQVTGSVIATAGFTGSLQGTATTASYVLNAVSSSFASTASFVRTAQTASYVVTAVQAASLQTARTIGGVSFNGTTNINLPGVNTTGNQDTTGNASTATFASTANAALTGSGPIIVYNSASAAAALAGDVTKKFYAVFVDAKTADTYSYGFNTLYANSGSRSLEYIMGTNTLTVTSSYANQALSSSFAVSASRAVSSSFATTASSAVSSSFATTASYATVAQNVLNESSFALLGSPNIFTSNQTITAKLSQGNGTTVGTTKAYSCGISSGVVTLSAVLYGDVTANFNVDDQLVIYDAPFDDNYGIITSKIASVTYDSFVTLSTIITLYDTSIGTTTAYVGDLSVGVANWNGDQTIPANYSHAEGYGTTTLGDYSHAEGVGTNALGTYSHAEGFGTTSTGPYSHAEGYNTTATGQYSHAEGRETIATGDWSHAEGLSTVAQGAYQHVQGAYNLSSSAESAFIVGNGTSDGARSNLIFASGSQVQITGSLIVSGSGTFTNIGPAVFSGSVASTAGFTGSLQGTATTASYFSGTVTSASYATTASFVSGAVGGSGTVGAIAKFSGTATIANATADTDYLINSVNTIAYTAMGSTIKGDGVAVEKPHSITGVVTLTAGTTYFLAYYLPKAATITGVKWFQGGLAAGSSGSFGLYSVSGGTLTLQASSSFDTTVFSTSQNTFKSKAFTSTYAAPAGLYYIGALSLANSAIVGGIFAYNAGIYGADFSNSNRVVTTRVISPLPSTQTLSGNSPTQSAPGLFLY